MRRPLARYLLALFILAAVGAGAYAWWLQQTLHRLPPGLVSGNGRIEGTEIAIAAKFPGRIEEITADEGDDVGAGQLLVRLDDRALRAQLDAAKAQLALMVQRQTAAQAELERLKSEMHLALLDLDRSRRLLDRGYAPQARVDIDSTRVETADAAIKAAAAQVVESGSAIDGAKARVAELEANLSDMQIYSPRTARVLFRLAEPGEVLSAGGRVFLLVDLDDLTMTVYVGEAQAGQVRVGDAARIRLDALPEHLIDATVSFIAAEAEFTPKEVETAEERQKLVFRVKLRVADNKDRLIKPGMPGVGYIRTDPSASWPETLP